MKQLIYYIDGKIGVRQENDDYQLKSYETFQLVPIEMVKPIVVGGVFVESATSQEIVQFEIIVKQKFLIFVDQKVNKLIAGAASIILGLQGLTPNEVQSRKELYQDLNTACLDPSGGSDPLLVIKKDLFNAKEKTSLTLTEYKALVVQKWSDGEAAFFSFKMMIEVVRTKWKSSIGNDVIFDSISEKLELLNTKTNPQDVPAIFNDIMTL